MSSGDGSGPIRIACIGSSVTKGTGLEQPDTESYPAQLASFLEANGYPAVDVQNFGEGGAGILKRGCNPYWDTDQYGDALCFDADVVIIHLGTNDSREEFWNNDAALMQAKENMFASFTEEEANKSIVHGELEFEQDLEELLEVFARMPANPEIFLCTPAPVFQSNGWLKQEILLTEVAPRIRKVAARQKFWVVELLDSLLAKRFDLFPDGVHPNADGAVEIASLIGRALLKQRADQECDRDGCASEQAAIESHDQVLAEEHESASAHDGQRMDDDREMVLRELQRMTGGYRSIQ